MRQRHRVLLLSEDAELCRTLSEGLPHHGFDVVITRYRDVVPDLFHSLGPFDVIVLSDEPPRATGRLLDEDLASGELAEPSEPLVSLKELLDRLRGENPPFQAVLRSGRLERDDAQRVGLGLSAVVRKPFLVEDLGRTIRTVLAGGR